MSSNLFISKTPLKKPTRLYIKQSPLGLKYFGRHNGNNIEKYTGSGKRWKRHLKKNNIKPIHLWNSDWFYYKEDIVKFAKLFSILNNIVNSENWANLVNEDGLLKDERICTSEETKTKISQTLKSDKFKSKMGNNLGGKKTQQSEEWKLGNYIICEKCNAFVSPGNHVRWHGENCANLTNEEYQSINNKIEKVSYNKGIIISKEILANRPQIKMIKEIVNKHKRKIQIKKGWWQKSDQWLDSVLEILKEI